MIAEAKEKKMKLKDDLSGPEALRLGQLLVWLGSQGVNIPKDSEAGENPQTGNIYLFSEEWAATPYITICGSMAWSYSCGGCGNEHDFPTLKGAEEYASKWGK